MIPKPNKQQMDLKTIRAISLPLPFLLPVPLDFLPKPDEDAFGVGFFVGLDEPPPKPRRKRLRAAVCLAETGEFTGVPHYLCEKTRVYLELIRGELKQADHG